MRRKRKGGGRGEKRASRLISASEGGKGWGGWGGTGSSDIPSSGRSW